VTSQRVVCAMTSGQGSYQIEEKRGTASVVEATGGTCLEAKALDAIISEFPRFARANVLKIDTDGNDFDVLRGAMTFIASQRPIILFECYQGSNTNFVEDGLHVLGLLKDAGYERYLVYDNYGYLMGWHALADWDAFRQLMFYQLAGRLAYVDILIMQTADIAAFLASEVDFFADHMLNKQLQPTARSAVKFGA